MHLTLSLFLAVQFAVVPVRSWLGIQTEVNPVATTVNGRTFAKAIRVTAVSAGSPAARAGFRNQDLIVTFSGVDFGRKADQLNAIFTEAVGATPPGTRVVATVIREEIHRQAAVDGESLPSPRLTAVDAVLRQRPPGAHYELKAVRQLVLLEIPVVLEPKGSRRGNTHPLPPDAAIFPAGFPVSAEEQLARRLLAQRGLQHDMDDLLHRLSNLEQEGDFWRLSRMAYSHRNPFCLPAESGALLADIETCDARGVSGLAGYLETAGTWLDRSPVPVHLPRLARVGLTIDERISEILDVLKSAKVHYDKAFRLLTDAQMDFLMGQLNVLGQELTRDIYLEGGLSELRVEGNMQIVELAKKVDMPQLFAAARILAAFVEQSRGDFRKDLERGFKGTVNRLTEFGPIIIGGKGHNEYTDDAAVIIDLGGNDFYSGHAATAAGRAMPFSIVIDYEGDDAYETSVNWAQGCGRLGVGILADFGGNDSYVAQSWAQGCAALGVGLLFDSDGDDNYRAKDYVQGAAFAGISLLHDAQGHDTYSATRFAQGCAFPGAFAHLYDGSGDDSYYAKGNYRTNYGDTGTFDSWSQGCAMGFRGVASGGIALLSDRSGNDRYEAGNFSQGGGYYFGWGLLHDGAGDDWYMGSRYAQGFAAHQALGYFQDDAGNDRYGTRYAVAQGVSWDESVVGFIDRAGDDRYSGGEFVSLGAAAHNGFCLFLDQAGVDTYDYAGGPGRGGPNDYHGGTSLAVFIDAGGGQDRYSLPTIRNNAVTRTGDNGLVIDLPGSVAGELACPTTGTQR